MNKYTLEIELECDRSCQDCPVLKYHGSGELYCGSTGTNIVKSERPEDCPLVSSDEGLVCEVCGSKNVAPFIPSIGIRCRDCHASLILHNGRYYAL